MLALQNTFDLMARAVQVCRAPPHHQSRRRQTLVSAALLVALNPIEQTFAKITHWMPAAQKRTIYGISCQLGNLIQTIQPNECKNSFTNAGYASIKT